MIKQTSLLKGCQVLPPMPASSSEAPQAKSKPAAKPAKPASSERFGGFNQFCDVILRDLSRTEITTWLMLWRDTKKDGLARTSQTDIAQRSGASLRSVERAIRSLIKKRLLLVVLQGRKNCGPSTYRVVVNLPPRFIPDTHDGVSPT